MGKMMRRVITLAAAAVVLSVPAWGQETLVDGLLQENSRLRAEIARLRQEESGQCVSAGQPGGDQTVTLLMQKLSQMQDEVARAALGPPKSPIILPDTVLSALVPDQYIMTLAPDQPDLATPEDVAAAFDLAPLQVRYVYSRVLRGFSAVLTPAQQARLGSDLRLSSVMQDGFVFPAQTKGAPSGPPGAASEGLSPLLAPSKDLIDVYVFDSGIRAGHAALNGLTGQGFTSFRNGIGTEDCNGHGTHVAGSIGGRQFGQTDRARLLSVKVLDRDSYGDVSTVIAGVEWVLAQPGQRKIANMSLTRLDPAPLGEALLDRAVMALLRAGIPVVVAAGNSASDARLYSPARLPDVITVGAMEGDHPVDSSNTGEGVDLYVQGAAVASASLSDNCSYERMTGTSMAAARVTGVATDLLAHGASVAALRDTLLRKATEVETGQYAGEVTRHVLSLRPDDPSGLCGGTGLEVHPQLVP